MTELTIDTVKPSDFNFLGVWCCTIGKAEDEECAWALCWYLSENGDKWTPAKAEDVHDWILAKDPGYKTPSFLWNSLRKHEHDGVVSMNPAWIPLLRRVVRLGSVAP